MLNLLTECCVFEFDGFQIFYGEEDVSCSSIDCLHAFSFSVLKYFAYARKRTLQRHNLRHHMCHHFSIHSLHSSSCLHTFYCLYCRGEGRRHKAQLKKNKKYMFMFHVICHSSSLQTNSIYLFHKTQLLNVPSSKSFRVYYQDSFR